MLKIRPISLKDANTYVEQNHRHHRKTQGHKFSIAVYSDNVLSGVAICGRPLSRYLDDGKTIEVLRLCTDGTENACSMLYGRCARIAKEMGYEKIITYILEDETGNSLKASGWKLEAENVGGIDWNVPSRPREVVSQQLSFFEEKPKYPSCKKKRYSRVLNEGK